jgi:predicted dehydrogenase
MSHWHAVGYENAGDCIIVALADLNEENARFYQGQHGGDRIYSDYKAMLAEENLDAVSVCTWPGLHAEMVVAAAEAGVKAIHCEKPMAPSLAAARRMVEICEQHGAQLTLNHQRRFGDRFRRARALLDEGAIGELIRLEGSCGNMFDWGTHWFDMFFFYNGETPADWVLGAVDWRDGSSVFGAVHEGQGLSHIKFRNGVHGLMVTGHEDGWEAQNRLIGTAGTIEVNPVGGGALRIWNEGQTAWQEIETDAGRGDLDLTALGVVDAIDALRSGREPELAGRRALAATELIFATYESSHRRARVELPLAATELDLTKQTLAPSSVE